MDWFRSRHSLYDSLGKNCRREKRPPKKKFIEKLKVTRNKHPRKKSPEKKLLEAFFPLALLPIYSPFFRIAICLRGITYVRGKKELG